MKKARRNKAPLFIGLTGGVATGKTTVARVFRRLGAAVIDADDVAHEMIKKGGQGHKKIVGLFGKKILSPNGEINRVALANLVFGRSKKEETLRKKLEAIIHPRVWRSIEDRGFSRPFVVIEVPLLFEAGWHKKMDLNMVVVCKKSQQRARCCPSFRRRIDVQMPMAKKAQLADIIIDNSGSVGRTTASVKLIYGLLKALFPCG